MTPKSPSQMRAHPIVAWALATVLAGFPSATRAGESAAPVWPLEGRPAISSNFCEYREGHFHAGLDIRTYGEEGVPCVASADGYVSRMRASPEGYGKALYVRLDSGETLVYAHLAEFDSTLEEELYRSQQRAGRYDVDVRFPRGRFPVRRGAVIAWSGSTGGIPPHLHFEVRDRGENPLNPFSNGFALEDVLSPEFRRVEFKPLGPGGLVNGYCWPVQFTAKRVAAGRWVLADTLVLSAGVGVAAEVYDRLNSRSGRLAPYRITLAVDDSVVADIRLERFSFAHADQVDFLYEVGRIRREKTYFIQLFESAGETIWNRSFRAGGSLPASPAADRDVDGDGQDVHRGLVTATDVAGNAARLEFFFVSGKGGRLTRTRWENTPLRLDTALPGHYFRESMVSTFDPIGDALLGKKSDTKADPDQKRPFEAYRSPNVYTASELADGPFVSGFRQDGRDDYAYLIGLRKGRPTSVNFSELGLQLIFGQRTLYSDAVVYARSWTDAGVETTPRELIPRTDPVQIGPYSIRLRADMEVRLSVGYVDSTSAIYRLNERKGEWVFYESTAESGAVRTTARRPGVYCAFDDRFGPRIGAPLVRVRRSYATGRPRPVIEVPIEDSGAGVSHGKTGVFIDGIEQIAYWDSRSKKMFVTIRDPNIMGPRSISVVAYDNAGNRSQLEADIDITIDPQKREKD
ncbi:MAG: M23 family metallopeptidase [Candidatus Latescibacterota bacterium]